MLIRRAELQGRAIRDIRLDRGIVTEIAAALDSRPGETVLEAGGAALLPGLHDHHLHLVSLAAVRASLPCGPPDVRTEGELARRLIERAAVGEGWIRGIQYHDSVAGPIDRHWLDRHVAHRPVRIQHRSGRLWVLNSAALALVASADTPLERDQDGFTGRLYDADTWLRGQIGGERPSLAEISRALAAQGVTGLTDATPRNDLAAYRHFTAAQASGELLQRLLVMGDAGLDAVPAGPGAIARGPWKLHLHDTDPPPYDGIVAAFRRSHAAGRPVAVHCVTLTELVLATTALAETGAVPGDRIEHASVTPPELLPILAELGVTVVTQPNFIRERGDAYRTEIVEAELPWLYRGRSFLDAGIPLAAGSDAPFGRPEPWQAMQAAVDRRSAGGAVLGPDEALSPEQALSLFLGPLNCPAGPARRIEIGVPADLCLLDRDWSSARAALAEVRVRATLRDGHSIWQD
jgi:predicted amidohydrolase YtcJ